MTRATWQLPERMPSHAELHPLPLDVAALVAAGHLVEVEPDVYRRAHHAACTQPHPGVPPGTPTHRNARSPRP